MVARGIDYCCFLRANKVRPYTGFLVLQKAINLFCKQGRPVVARGIDYCCFLRANKVRLYTGFLVLQKSFMLFVHLEKRRRMIEKYPIILASASPRRRELFAVIAEPFECENADVDELNDIPADARALCLELARRKCLAVAERRGDCAVIGCDTVVALDGENFGKPQDVNEARAMLQKLSGRKHEVYTGVYIRYPGGARHFVCRSSVTFFPLSKTEIEQYIATPEPYDKAGGYGIQGAAAKFVKSINGDYFNVMGLPVSRLYRLLNRLDLL